jgi:hypothetical protein
MWLDSSSYARDSVDHAANVSTLYCDAVVAFASVSNALHVRILRLRLLADSTVAVMLTRTRLCINNLTAVMTPNQRGGDSPPKQTGAVGG